MNAVLTIKDILKTNNDSLQQQFDAGQDIAALLKSRSDTIDEQLRILWQELLSDLISNAALVAVGGYGRQEMHPASDIDLLILLKDEPNAEAEQQLSDFVTKLWDLGLEIGHSVRTLSECVSEATSDLTVITNLIESRFLCGDGDLFSSLQAKISPDLLWSSPEFYLAKLEEQKERYKRYGDTAYRVEPNLKDGPGGLRDLQMIGWITLREYGIGSLKTLSEANDNDLLNADEYKDLIEARDFLWQVRFALHQLTGRKEDRLLFDHQRHLAHSFGYTNDEKNASIESFMQRYYQNITQLERLNEILIGLLREHILQTNKKAPIAINKFYANQEGYLELTIPRLFDEYPHTLLEVFNIIQTTPELEGMTPRTIRSLRRHLHLIDDEFRNNAHNKRIFMSIISESAGINFALRRMNRYGVLAAYIPAFANIVGRMQYDLFHAYTVDDHTLNVVRNIRVLSNDKGKKEMPFCYELFKTVENRHVLYLAGIFHDIAKGRGGSHSELGAVDALEFCMSHEMPQEQAETVSWLVEQHLQLSTTAQREDINDPEVIAKFAETMGSLERLTYLYLLTISDIRGTNPTLLNSWKHSLLQELYRSTAKYLQLKNPTQRADNDNNKSQIVENKKRQVLAFFKDDDIPKQVFEKFWQRFDDDYFIQYQLDRLVWHIQEIALPQYQSQTIEDTIIRISKSENKHSSVLLIYTKDQKGLLVKITSAVEQHHLDTVAANITSTLDGYDLYTFYVLNASGEPLKNEDDKAMLLKTVQKNLEQEQLSYNFAHHRMPRQLKHFNTPTDVSFSQDKQMQQTIITIRTADGAGLLTQIGEVFIQQGLTVHNARISTLGEIAEDIFHVTTIGGSQILDEQKQQQIKELLSIKLGS